GAAHLGVELGDDGLDEAAAHGDDEHQARGRERDDVEPLEHTGGEARAEDDAEEVRKSPEQARRLAEELLGIAVELLDAGAEEPLLRGRDARPVHQLVHEGPVAEVRRDAAGGGVRVVEIAEPFERAERAPDRRRGEVHDAALGDGLRADGRRRLDELRDDGAQDDGFALAQRRALQFPVAMGRAVNHDACTPGGPEPGSNMLIPGSPRRVRTPRCVFYGAEAVTCGGARVGTCGGVSAAGRPARRVRRPLVTPPRPTPSPRRAGPSARRGRPPRGRARRGRAARRAGPARGPAPSGVATRARRATRAPPPRRARASTSREARAGPRVPRRSASPRRARRAPRPSRSPPTRRASRGSPAAPSRRARARGPSPRTPPPRRRRAAAARSGSAPRAGARRESRRSSQPGETRRTGGRTAPRISDRRSFRSTRTLSDRMGRFLLSLVAAFLGALAACFLVPLFGATLLRAADTTPRVEAASVLELELGGRIPEVAPLNPFGSLVGARATTLR